MFTVASISRFFVIVLSAFLMISCGVYREAAAPERDRGSGSHPPAMSVNKGERVGAVQEKLQAAHYRWRGTPYRLGGDNKKGVDCSAFTQNVFRDFFDVSIPRHTSRQLQEGSGIRRNQIRPGDLIFFRTKRGVLHVGIAMGEGDFLHASVSSGVMISNIGENYWASRYLGARRVLR